ncbi:hypothetical protein FKM82_029547 [Ascaphus truei]
MGLWCNGDLEVWPNVWPTVIGLTLEVGYCRGERPAEGRQVGARTWQPHLWSGPNSSDGRLGHLQLLGQRELGRMSPSCR